MKDLPSGIRKAFNDGIQQTVYVVGSPVEAGLFPHGKKAGALKSLNVGCGTTPFVSEQWINTDITPAPHVNMVFDCGSKWPIETASIGNIYASHVVEHLDNPIVFFNEALRCMVEDGSLLVRVPHPRHGVAFGREDHKRPIEVEFFQALTMSGADHRNLSYNDKPPMFFPYFFIHCVDKKTIFAKWWMPKFITRFAATHLVNVCSELWVWLRPFPKEATP